jgi:hypothetical protein
MYRRKGSFAGYSSHPVQSFILETLTGTRIWNGQVRVRLTVGIRLILRNLFCVSHRKSACVQAFDPFNSHLWSSTNNIFIQDAQLLI